MLRSRTDPILMGAFGLLVLGLALRLLHLGADAPFPLWSGWVGDEARWTQVAHDWASFRAVALDSPLTRTHLFLAPLFQAATAVSLSLFGPGLEAARLVTAVAGLGVLALAAGLFLRAGRPAPAFVAVALLAIHPDLVYFSRVAIPEMPALLLQLAAFAVLVAGRPGPGRAFVGGLLFALAAGFKGTVLPVLPGFLAVIWLTFDGADPRRRISAVLAFVGAVAAGALVPVVGVVAMGLGERLRQAGGLSDLLEFLAGDSAYGMLSTLHDGEHTILVNLGLALIWVPAVVRLAAPREARTLSWKLLVGGAIWAVGWIAAWAWLEYFPSRYVVHVHVPLLVALAGAMAVGAEPVPRLPDGRLRRALMCVVISVPLAFAVAPAVANLLHATGPTFDRIRHHVGLGLGLSLVLGAVAHRARDRSVLPALALVPGIVAVIWWVARDLAWMPETYWALDGWTGVLRWVGVWLAAAVVFALVTRGAPIMGGAPVRRIALVLGLAWGVFGVVDRPAPTYTLDEVARYLDQRYEPGTTLGTLFAGTALLGTRLRWAEPFDTDPLPAGILVFWGYVDEDDVADYTLVREFPLDLGGDFRFYHEFHAPASLRLYEPSGGAGSAATISPGSP